ncbi:DoxX family protein [Thalassoglobus polymorphus]|uniref:Methylamine utilisation protein MauE domain-containing protein n=1 Tax=Thalassoglobus polymorphus TaxID=2527994 RepID=A0A517QIF6_9PLAN|nr:DoxX family protein [Thalassoglobus polymorphus]QDT31394.1 hypothetical protein Mal48_06270 [Thalassoglobus polymorphus]
MTPSDHSQQSKQLRLAKCLVRIALAAAFLSAVADRFGLWGPPGSEGVVWGNIKNYEAYVQLLNWFAPASLIPFLGWVATVAEIVIAIGLLIGWKLRWFSLAAGILLSIFTITMMSAFGPKPPLDYSVLSAASAAFLLFTVSAPGNRNHPQRNDKTV